MSIFFSKMIGTLAVIILVAGYIGANDLLSKFYSSEQRWKYIIISGIIGGIFGIYGNISGVSMPGSGAVISVRDIGPMLSGFMGGPLGGLLSGLICGYHRYTMGGITAVACIIATCAIGVLCGFITLKFYEKAIQPRNSFIIGVLMECLHLAIVLIVVKPFDTALDIVRQIAFPFVITNAVGFAFLISIMTFIERQRDITLAQSRLQSELEVASVVQHSLLPPITDTFPGRKEFEIRAIMETAKEVGGDFYDFFFVGPEKMAVIIADVSGKGVPAAMFMATAKLTLQNAIRDIPDLAEAVCAANNNLCARNEADMFVTAWIGLLDIPTGEMEFVCAGHNPPVLMRSDRAEFVRVKSGLVLGGMEGIPYRKETLTLGHGDKLFLYTDGVTEAENEFHELFTEKRLGTRLDLLRDKEPEEIINSIRSDITSHVHGCEQFDDITMLCLKYN